MPTLSPDQLLDNARFTALMLDQATTYTKNLPLRFINRLTPTNADDNEILATYTERILAADVIAPDQAAAVYGGGSLSFVTHVLPVIKFGRGFSGSLVSRLNRIRAGQGSVGDFAAFTNWENRTAENILLGVRQQMNAMAAGMMLDSWSYSRNGVIIAGSWGMPSGLKVTPSTAWTNTAATPITDILTVRQTAQTTYGTTFDRITIGTADLLNMAKTTEFQSLIPGLAGVPASSTSGSFNPRDSRIPAFVEAMTQMSVEVEDGTYQRQNADGSFASATRYLPAGKVLLSNTSDDRNPLAWDWGNAVIDESAVAAVTGGLPGIAGERYGPVGYYTPSNPSFNPPGLVAWGVCKGFPRRFNVNNTAVLTVQ